MSTHTSEVLNLYKSRNTLLELLAYQGFETSEYENYSISEVHSMFINRQLDILLEKKEKQKQKNKVFVKYHLAKTLRPNHIYEYIEDVINIDELISKDDTFIILTREKANDTIVKLLQHVWAQDNVHIIIFDIKALLFNPLKHVLVPKHRILSDIEVSEIEKKYNIRKKDEFNEISRFDPIAKAIGMKPDEICEIIRPSKTSINSYNYRLCV